MTPVPTGAVSLDPKLDMAVERTSSCPNQFFDFFFLVFWGLGILTDPLTHPTLGPSINPYYFCGRFASPQFSEVTMVIGSIDIPYKVLPFEDSKNPNMSMKNIQLVFNF